MKTKSILYWCACGALTLVPFTGQASDLDVSASDSNTTLFRNHGTIVAHVTATPLSEIILPISVRQHAGINFTTRYSSTQNHHASSGPPPFKRSPHHIMRHKLRCMQVRYNASTANQHRHRCASFLFRRGMLARPRIRL